MNLDHEDADPDPACHSDAKPVPDLTFHFYAEPDLDPSFKTLQRCCAAEAIFCCPTENSHHLKS